MDGSCANDTCTYFVAPASRPSTTSPRLHREASSYSKLRASSYSYADRALELGKSAATWQLVVALYVALLVLRMHGRFILWSWLTKLLVFLHALYVVYQLAIVAVNIVVSALNIFANLFKLYAAAARWIRGGNIRRRYARSRRSARRRRGRRGRRRRPARRPRRQGGLAGGAGERLGDGASVVALTSSSPPRGGGRRQGLVQLVRS